MNGGDPTGRSLPRIVHIVDATKGPLIGEGRLRRVTPFAATATISMVISVPAASWNRPGAAIAGSVLIAATIIGSLVVPWDRLARAAQLAVPFAFLVATLLLASASGYGVGSPFVTMAVLPMVWLATYEKRTAVLSAAILAGLFLWLAVPGGNPESSAHGGVYTAVFIVCGAGMGVTLHGLVADARRVALALRENQDALEQTASMLDALPERVNRYRVSDHTITYCNAAWATQYQVEPAEALGRSLDEFLSEDELDGLHSQLELLGPDNPVLVDRVARAVPNAPGQWLEWADRYLTDAGGAEVLSIGRDVTKRHVAELELAESEARFRDLADKSADVVWRFIVEPAPHFDYMSPSVEHVLGYPPSYFLENFTHMLDILDDAGTTAVARALNGEQVLGRFDFRFRHAERIDRRGRDADHRHPRGRAGCES